MPREPGNANMPVRWLESARADLAVARIALPEDAMYEQLCFHAQQAAEKSIKALLLYLGIDFPFTHNIGLLVSILPSEMQQNPLLSEAVILTPYAVLTRYPGEVEPVTQEKYTEAVGIASSVVEWISAYIRENP